MFKAKGHYIFSVILEDNAISTTDLSFKIMISSSDINKLCKLDNEFCSIYIFVKNYGSG